MDTSHREQQTGQAAAIFEEKLAMVCDGLRCLQKLKIAGKWKKRPTSVHNK